MARQFMCGTVSQSIASTETKNRLENSISEFCNQMNSTSADHTWGKYTPDWNADTAMASNEYDYLGYFAEDIASAARNGDITTASGDAWVLLDGHWGYGYGKARSGCYVDLTGDGVKDDIIHVCRALSMGNTPATDPDDLTTSFIIHEFSHLFDSEHGDGKYDKNNGYVNHVSPMASSYVRAVDGSEPDTSFGGTGNVPDDFNSCTQYQQPNYISDEYCGDHTNWCVHDWNLRYCAKNEIKYYTPLEG